MSVCTRVRPRVFWTVARGPVHSCNHVFPMCQRADWRGARGLVHTFIQVAAELTVIFRHHCHLSSVNLPGFTTVFPYLAPLQGGSCARSSYGQERGGCGTLNCFSSPEGHGAVDLGGKWGRGVYSRLLFLPSPSAGLNTTIHVQEPRTGRSCRRRTWSG